MRQFWHRWIREWLSALNVRRRWLSVERDIQVDGVVSVISPKTTRGHWPLGGIVKVYPSKDGHVRVSKVQVGKEECLWPITKLCQLELSLNAFRDNDSDKDKYLQRFLNNLAVFQL